MDSQNKLKLMFWRRAFSALIDVVFVYCLGYLVHLLIMRLIFFEPVIVFAVSWFFYYSVCYHFFKGRTLAKMITGLQVVSENNKTADLRQIVIREVISKFFLLLVIPGYVIHRLHFYTKTQVQITGALLLILFLLMLILFFIYRRPWWELLSFTKTVRNHEPRKLIRFVAFMAIAILSVMTIYIKTSPSIKDFRLSLIKFFPNYPDNAETRRYSEFIRSHSQDPVEYVFDLFKKYDLVVIDERLHPEYTQYELFSKIVGDPRFAARIGNIYTEIGTQLYQDTLTWYLNTIFSDEESLNKATAWLQNNSSALWPSWGYTNMFDFLKLVNGINTRSADSLKINWYCTDIPIDWAKMTRSKFLNIPRKEKRDKIMADRITSIYNKKVARNERKKKGLVIMNHWHGFGLIREPGGKKSNHFLNAYCATAILMDSLPGKVCNVLINTIPFGVYGTIFGPVRHSKWDKAFEMAGNPEAGFNFENSPFGADNFDEFLWNSSSELQYQDVFTGFIFYKPLEQHKSKVGFPHMLYNFKDTLLRRSACLGEKYEETVANEIIRNAHELNKTIVQSLPYAMYYNVVENIGYSLIIALALLIYLIFYFKSWKRK